MIDKEESHPTWVRGLKPKHLAAVIQPRRSHPTWVRGLKHFLMVLLLLNLLSHPTWVRGLKLNAQKANIEADSRTLRGCVD